MKEQVNKKGILKKVIISLIFSMIIITMILLAKRNFEVINNKYIFIIIGIIIVFSFSLLIIKIDKLKEKVIFFLFQCIDFFMMLVIALAILEAIFIFWFFPSEVEQSSMTPTLTDGTKVFVNVTSDIKRYDIVVVEYNDKYNRKASIDNGELLIKRLIALPGDKFYFDKNGILYVNGEMIDEKYLKDENGNFLKGLYEETHDYYDASTLPFSQYKEIEVPDGFYFFVGDNRSFSEDSRSLGLFSEEQIIGVVKYKVDGFFKISKIEKELNYGTW